MNRLADALTASHPHWGPLPDELVRAFAWMAEHGYLTDTGEQVFLTPFDDDDASGVVFTSGLSLDGWLEKDAAGSLLPIADTDGSGGMAALWHAPDGGTRVVLIDDLDRLTLAPTVLDFLRLVAVGHEQLTSFSIGEVPDPEVAQAHSPFREWLSATFGVTVPDTWESVGEDDFTDWWNAQTGDSAPMPTTENPDVEAGHTSVTGPITVLLELLGSPDGPEAAAAMSEVVGVDVGEKLKSATRQLKPRGVEVDIARGKVNTIWVHLGVGRGMYGMPPTTAPLWSGPDLIDGMSAATTRAEVRERLGTPEREGAEHLRYRVGDRYLHLSFGETDLLALITLMTTVP